MAALPGILLLLCALWILHVSIGFIKKGEASLGNQMQDPKGPTNPMPPHVQPYKRESDPVSFWIITGFLQAIGISFAAIGIKWLLNW